MSGSEFSVDLGHLDHVVTQLTNLSGFLADHLAALDQKVAALHAGSWDSVAAAAHATAHREWATAAGEFAEGVTDMSAAARNAHAQYTAAIGANTRMFGGG